MRCFVAVDFAREERVKILEIQKRFSQFTSLRPVPENSMHITLSFLGDIEPAEAEKVKLALKSSTKRNNQFPCSGKSLCVFPTEDFFRVLCIELDCKEAFSLLQKDVAGEIEKALGRENPFDRNEFVPHITIARVNNASEKKEILAKVNSLRDIPKISFNVSEIKLKESRLLPGGAKYTDLEAYPLSL